jgi:pyridoxamine 5'-phosphate oxidase
MVNRPRDLTEKIATLRRDYQQGFTLDVALVDPDPFEQFTEWFNFAVKSGIREPNAMSLATVNGDGKPSVRVVLMKDYSEAGFVFYTNYQSRKGIELATNPHAALVFLWVDLERQIRIEGSVSKISEAQSEAYFNARPRSAQIGAIISAQSSVLSSRDELQKKKQELELNSEGKELTKPKEWGGYCVSPTQFEFWQGQASRMHDRIRYQLVNNAWVIDRLSP